MRRALLLCVGSGCATLGPMPATTGMSAVPAGRPDAELQLGVMPGYYLSQSTQEDPRGDGIAQLALAVEPERAIRVPGLVLGFRLSGPEGDTRGEPMIGYRRAVDAERRVSVAGYLFATHGSASRDGAEYEASRGGGEVAVDLRLGAEHRWAEAHLVAAASVTALDAEGTYCQDSTNTHGRDCPDPPTNLVTATASGVYPAATAGLALDLARHRDHVFHGARLLALAAVGTMPQVLAGEQVDAETYVTIGLAMSISMGAR